LTFDGERVVVNTTGLDESVTLDFDEKLWLRERRRKNEVTGRHGVDLICEVSDRELRDDKCECEM
jgi:hypothetical protein